MSITIDMHDNSDQVIKAAEAAIQRALERCGLKAEAYAKQLCPVDTGNLRNSITHEVVTGEKAAYIGTNNEYAVYNELGTGKYTPGGRPTPWVYQDAKGNFHRTHGMKPRPFIKPTVADHAADYKTIIEHELKNG